MYPYASVSPGSSSQSTRQPQRPSPLTLMSAEVQVKATPPSPSDDQADATVVPGTPTRPITPQARRTQPPHTPDSAKAKQPRTPYVSSLAAPTPAAIYLSSPIRRKQHAGTMTPGRPTTKFAPGSPFKPRRHPHGRVSIGGAEPELPGMPLQFLFMTVEQAKEITDLNVAKETLVTALQQSDAFRRAAQQFRGLASQYIFQHRLSRIEVDENEQRHEVETSLHKREVERLVVEAMGYEKNVDSEQIRKRLRHTRHRMHEMEAELETKDRIIQELTMQLQAVQQRFALQTAPPVLPPPASPDSEALSPLEVLASQVLSNGIHADDKHTQSFNSSPYSSPFREPFSPFQARVHSESKPPTAGGKRRLSSASTISLSDNETVDESRED